MSSSPGSECCDYRALSHRRRPKREQASRSERLTRRQRRHAAAATSREFMRRHQPAGSRSVYLEHHVAASSGSKAGRIYSRHGNGQSQPRRRYLDLPSGALALSHGRAASVPFIHPSSVGDDTDRSSGCITPGIPPERIKAKYTSSRTVRVVRRSSTRKEKVLIASGLRGLRAAGAFNCGCAHPCSLPRSRS